MNSSQAFEVLVDGVMVGTTMFEHGDAAMGVAFGDLVPIAAYAAVSSRFRMTPERNVQGGDVAVRVPGAKENVPCAAAGILDATFEMPDEPVVVEVLGIPYPTYERLFPHHVASYEAQSSAGGT